jgi:hypothetical protein
VLELRLAQVKRGDPELVKLVRRAVNDLPHEPGAALSSARDILDRAFRLVWEVETPGGTVQVVWIEHWRNTEVATGRPVWAVVPYTRAPAIPEERGAQCSLLRLATGQLRIPPIAGKVSKSACVLLDHMNHVGDLKNHSKGEPTLTMAVAFCFAAIELAEVLGRDLAS